MAINISFQPSAAAVGGAALVGGQGQYNKWLNQFRQGQYQFGVQAAQQAQQMQLSQMNAMAHLAAQQQMQSQNQQFELQKMPMQAQIQAQQQAYQSGLAGQNQQNAQLLGAQIHSQQSNQDFGEAQQLAQIHGDQIARQAEASRAAQVDGQQQVYQYQQQLKDQHEADQIWQNPLQQHLQNVQKAQQSGMTFSPEAQTKVNGLRSDVSALQDSVNSQERFKGAVMPELKSKVAQLNMMVPDQPPPKTTKEGVSEGLTYGWTDPATGLVKPGTENNGYAINPKTGATILVDDQGGKKGAGPTIDVDGEQVDAAAYKVGMAAAKEKQKWIKEQMQDLQMRKEMEQNAPLTPEQHQSMRSDLANQYNDLEREAAARVRSRGSPQNPAAGGGGQPPQQQPQGGQPPQQGGQPQVVTEPIQGNGDQEWAAFQAEQRGRMSDAPIQDPFHATQFIEYVKKNPRPLSQWSEEEKHRYLESMAILKKAG